jgi:hypothetical protein
MSPGTSELGRRTDPLTSRAGRKQTCNLRDAIDGRALENAPLVGWRHGTAVALEESMDAQAYVTIKRVILLLVFAYVAWPFLPNIIAYAGVVREISRQQPPSSVAAPMVVPSVPSLRDVATTGRRAREDAARKQASLGKINARQLESQLVEKNIVSRAAHIHCNPSMSTWDYVCSYLPTPRATSTRVQFGVQVDKKRWVEMSPIVPEGTTLAPPKS